MIGIDLQNRKPIYEQIVERFQTLIVNGVMEPDSQMPSVRALAMELSINPNTIQKAYSMLEQEGYIYPVKGRGNFVSGNAGLKLKKQEGVYRELRELVERGKELGIRCEEFTERAERYYRENRQGQTPADTEKAYRDAGTAAAGEYERGAEKRPMGSEEYDLKANAEFMQERQQTVAVSEDMKKGNRIGNDTEGGV